MEDKAKRARSFGAIAEAYDRLRPTAGEAAVDWLLPDDVDVAVDVGAGTGLFAGLLAARVPAVYAVEPDDRMREVLRRRLPGVTALSGTGEQIPLPDRAVDVAYVASAWHWLDPDRALPELARVLRDGGRLGVLWTSRDRDIDWVRDLDRPTDGGGWTEVAEARHRRDRAAGLDHVARFGFTDAARASFGFTRLMRLDDVVEMVATYSAVITAPDDVRRTLLDATRRRLVERFPGATEVDLPMRTWCWRATRQARRAAQ